MKKKLFGIIRSDRRGLALITVLGVVTLATLLIVALFTLGDNELRAAKSFSEGATARLMADNAVELVKGQIQAAAAGAPGAPRTIWASQPGALRVYNVDGTFAQGRKLYSSGQMVVNAGGLAGEATMSHDKPANDWVQHPDQWVDLNRPVQTQLADGSLLTSFPILDPRVVGLPSVGSLPGQSSSPKGPEGYEVSSKSADGSSVSWLNVPSGSDPLDGVTNQRIQMPVEWLYILKDGSVGSVISPGAGQNSTWAGSGAVPTVDNPIIGRVAFWTDDESCKVNINTAGEPSVWSLPSLYTDRDQAWANSQPAYREFQRYPGHPATIAISSVLAPGFLPEPTSYAMVQNTTTPDILSSTLSFKESLFELLPKIAPGGSRSGTRVFDPDSFGQDVATAVDFATSVNEPLYASVDEFFFNNNPGSGSGRRVPNTLNPPGGGGNAITPERINALKFFLTAQSRAPELTMFGTPRVAIWPVPDETGDRAPVSGGVQWATAWDRSIAAASTLGPRGSSNTYFFSRRNADSPRTDLGYDGNFAPLIRNQKIMDYLYGLMGQVMPGGSSFVAKYGPQDSSQILVQIFDYIRCTNLYDAFIADARKRVMPGGQELFAINQSAGAIETAVWRKVPLSVGSYQTFTEPRYSVWRQRGDIYNVPNTYREEIQPEAVETGMYPGHGQVTPAEWINPAAGGNVVYRGFGRFPTISEVALQFIASADGLPDNGSYAVYDGEIRKSGGKTAQKIDDEKLNVREYVRAGPGTLNTSDGRAVLAGGGDEQWDRWYSNLPPYPSMDLFKAWGCDPAQLNRGGPRDPARHPGFQPGNWNVSLDFNEGGRTDVARLRFPNSGLPLMPNEKRIQIAFLLETFVPAAGWTKYAPEFSLVFNGDQLAGLQVLNAEDRWVSVFDTTGQQAVQSTMTYMGGSKGMSESDNVYPIGGTYGTAALMRNRQVKSTSLRMPKDPGYVDTASGNIHGQMNNFPLVSNFLTVRRDRELQFRNNGGRLDIDIYPSHNYQRGAVPSQRVTVNLPDGKTPVPHLVVFSTEHRRETDNNGNYYDQDAIHACRWWCFNFGGVLDRYTGRYDPRNPNSVQVKDISNTGLRRPWGRFKGEPHASIVSRDNDQGSIRGGSARTNGTRTPTDSRRIPTSGTIYGYSPTTNFSGVYSNPAKGDFDRDGQFTGAGGGKMGAYGFYGSDSIRSLIPRHGDSRLVAARKQVAGTMWERHPIWQKDENALFAHSIMSFSSDSQLGVDLGGYDARSREMYPLQESRMVPAWYRINQVPDGPLTNVAASYANRYRDFDTGPGNMRDGPYINKPDDGNLSKLKIWHSGNNFGIYDTRNAYFTETWLQIPTRGAFATPNRMVSSPGVFGSLPTGVWGSLAQGDSYAQNHGVPFRTLLFRPGVSTSALGVQNLGAAVMHPGAPAYAGGIAPADHYVMDMFWMPIVEPYCLSHAFSTAGKINVNYQILPFSYIKRATGMYAVMKGERVTAVDYRLTKNTGANAAAAPEQASMNKPLIYKTVKDSRRMPHDYWSDNDMRYHYPINIPQTLKDFEDRFNCSHPFPAANGLFRTASQICEVHMIPFGVAGLQSVSSEARQSAMAQFWNTNALTGENLRERTYANIYGKVTNKSNTYRVHFIAQSIRKAASMQPNMVNTRSDTVTGEYRGSALIERYLNTEATSLALPNYAVSAPIDLPSLEAYHRFRVLEMKQFVP